jgi:hypothetical protein
MSEIKLKRCPFCGGEVAMNQDDDGYYVSCSKDGCVVMTNSYTEEEAIEVWNTRKPMQEIVERLEESIKFYDEKKKEAYDDKDWEDFDRNMHINHGVYEALAIVKKVGGMND